MTQPEPVTTSETRYGPLLAVLGHSPTLRAIWAAAYGEDYPADAEPMGFITVGDLNRIVHWLGIGPQDTLIDLGCGWGGPGRWIARATGASVVGIDIVPAAVEAAAGRAAQLGMTGRARYEVGSLTATGMPTDAFDAAISIDSMWMVLDKPTAVAEVARVLAPGCRWALTTWEPAYLSYRSLLEGAGFELLLHAEPAGWQDRQLAVYRGILDQEEQLRRELGSEATDVWVAEAREISPVLSGYRRLVIVARR